MVGGEEAVAGGGDGWQRRAASAGEEGGAAEEAGEMGMLCVCAGCVEGRGGNSSGSNSGGGNSSGGGWQRMNGMNQVDKEGAMAAGVEVLGKREVWRRRRGR